MWDRFHLVQNFNEALNEEQKYEWDGQKGVGGDKAEDDLLAGKYRYIYLTKSHNWSEKDQWHIEEVMSKDELICYLEFIKEYFRKPWDEQAETTALEMLNQCYEWACQIKAK